MGKPNRMNREDQKEDYALEEQDHYSSCIAVNDKEETNESLIDLPTKSSWFRYTFFPLKNIAHLAIVTIIFLLIVVVIFENLVPVPNQKDSSNSQTYDGNEQYLDTLPRTICGTSILSNTENDDLLYFQRELHDVDDDYNSNSNSDGTVTSKQNKHTQQDETQFKIENIEDLKSMRGFKSVKIVSLLGQETKTSPDEFLLHKARSVTSLLISAPVNPTWLMKIVDKLPSLRSLTLFLDEFCTNATTSSNTDTGFNEIEIDNINKELDIPSIPITFRNVISFRVVNNIQECSLHPWIFNWKFENLEDMELFNMNLNEGVFGSIHTFLEENKESIKTIIISNSYICQDCYVSDVDYRQLEMVKILQQRPQ